MRKTIEVSGVRVEKGLCTIAFSVATVFMRANKSVMPLALSNESVEITHADMYELLDTAIHVRENDGSDAFKYNQIAIIDMGNGICMDVWKM